MTERQKKALDTSLLRSETLLTTDGYSVTTHPSLKPGLYVVTKPEATPDRATGELVESYEVDIAAATCTCKQFEFSRGVNCKHLRATLRHIGQCYNLLAPMLAQSGLTIPAQLIPEAPKPTTEVSLPCPHCGHGSTIPLPDYPGQRVCVNARCLKTFDEIQSPSFGTRPRPVVPAATAPTLNAPTAPKKVWVSRAIPACSVRLPSGAPHGAMTAATRESTGQEGHLCLICHAWQPLGAYKPMKRPCDRYSLESGTSLDLRHSHDLDDDLPIGN